MTVMLAILCLIVALFLADPRWLSDIIGARSRTVLRRLSHFAPARTPGDDLTGDNSIFLAWVNRLLAILDPTFPPFARALWSVGFVSKQVIVATELGKLLISLICATIVGSLWGWPVSFTPMSILVSVIAGLAMVVLINGMAERTAVAHRRRVRSELSLAAEMLAIFLEGGQTLDQAFHSFDATCGDALPHIAAVQRALLVDLNNGVSYEKAIARWAESLDIEEAQPLAALFTESLLHGTELVSHLRQMATDLVETRILLARASIGKKSAQLTAVMVAFFLPAILAYVGAPATVAVLRAFGSMR